jgi:hypothetical protein
MKELRKATNQHEEALDAAVPEERTRRNIHAWSGMVQLD